MAKKRNNPHPRAATAEDKVLGNKLRAFRNAVQMSQQQLGESLDPPVSFQQIQKYEKGVNRVSHVKLTQICKSLGITVQDVIGDFKRDGQTSAQSEQVLNMMGDQTTFRMLKAFRALPRDMQFKFVALVETVQHGVATA
jgi:transcriptional regulator with XRE-family HTH domain